MLAAASYEVVWCGRTCALAAQGGMRAKRQTRRPALWLNDATGVERALLCSNNAYGMPQGKLGVQTLRALHGCKTGLLRASKLLNPCALCHTEAPCALCHTEAPCALCHTGVVR
jgi:hypothetical protein